MSDWGSYIQQAKKQYIADREKAMTDSSGNTGNTIQVKAADIQKAKNDYIANRKHDLYQAGRTWKKTSRLEKYRNKNFREIQQAMETLEDENEKKWLQENAARLPGWRKSIRDVGTLQNEITALTEQLERQRTGNDTAHREMLAAAGVHPELLIHFNAQDGEAEKQIQKQIQYLQEEYKWSSYFRDQEVMENIDQYVAEAEEAYNSYTNSAKYKTWKAERDRAMGQSGEVIIPGAWETDAKEEELRTNLEYYKNIQESRNDQNMMAADLEELASWSEADKQALMLYISNRNQEAYNPIEMKGVPGLQNAQEQASELIKKYGIQKVNELAESYMRSQTQQLNRDITTWAQEGADKGFWEGVGHSALSVGANLLGSMTSPLGYLVEGAQRTGRYSTLDTNNVGMLPGAYAGAVRETVAGNIEQGSTGKLGSTLYEAGMSALDNLVRIAVTGGGTASLALAATGSFGQTVSSMSEKGASPAEAVGMGILNGGLEILTEKISLDNLLKEIDNPKGIKETLKAMLRSGGVEVTEEELSFLGSTLGEALILREGSGYNRTLAQMRAYGLTEAQAREQAARGVIDEAFQTAVQSFLSGGMMSGATSLYSNTVNRLQNKSAEKQLQETAKNAAQQIQQGQQRSQPKVTIEKGTSVDKSVQLQAERISGATGRKIVFYSSQNGEDGFYSSDGVIHVNTNGVDPVAQIISHELTHSVEMAEAYKELSSLVLARIEQTGGNLQQQRIEKQNQYTLAGHPLNSTEEVDSEIVAHYVANYLLKDEQSITSLVQENPSLGQRIKNWLESLLAKFGNTNAQESMFIRQARDAYARALNQSSSGSFTKETMPNEDSADSSEQNEWSMEEMLDWARDMYASGEWSEEQFDSFMESFQEWEDQTGIDGMAAEDRRFAKTNSSDNQYSISRTKNMSWDQQITSVLQKDGNIIRNDTLIVDSVPAILKEKGIQDVPLAIPLSVISKAKSGKDVSHSIKNKNLRKLQRGIRNAPIIIDNPQRNALVFVTNIEQSGAPVLIAFQKDTVFDGDRVHKATSIHLQMDVMSMLQVLPEESTVYVHNKNELNKWVGVTNNLRSLAANVEFISNSIDDTEENVKRQYSISDSTISKRDVARQLQAIIDRGGDPTELQRYVRSLGGGAEPGKRGNTGHEESGARRILQAAKRQGIGVEEYLQQNWEQYDSDGEWNAEAREALDLERRGRRKYSISDVNKQYEGKNLSEDRSLYTYDFLTSLPDMQTITLPDVDAVRSSDKRVDTAKVIEMGIKNALSVGEERDGKPYVKNRYTGRMLRVDTSSIRHGLNGDMNRILTNARLGSVIGDVIQNAVPINALHNTADGVAGTYAMASYAIDEKARAFVAIITVEQRSEKVSGVDTYDVTHAVSGRQKRSKQADTKSQGVYPSMLASEISISDLLTAVKETYQSVLPDDVLAHFDEAKNPDGYYYGRVKYSISDSGLATDIEQQLKDGNTNVYGYELAGFDEGEPGVRNPSVMIRKPGQTGNPTAYELPAGINTENAIIRRAAEIIAQDYQTSQQTEETQESQTPAKTPEEIRDELPAKARIYLQRAETNLVNTIGENMGVPKFARREYLKQIAQEISNEYLSTGTVSDDTISLLFDKAYANGVVVDREFYDQYKHIKDHLKTTSVTISQRDQSDIADFSDFRRRAFGTLRIVNEGGLPVDSAYHELNTMCPELFPESITHPADQLQRMYEVGQSIQISQKTLDEYYGDLRDDYRRWARNDFESAVGNIFGELQQVKRFADERSAQETERVEITEDEAAELYQELKAARKNYEKVNAKNILTDHDDMQVGRLLRGEIQLEHLDPKKDFIKGIKAVFEAKQEYEKISKKLAAYKRQQKVKHIQRADDLLKTADTWKDKKTGIAYSRETMRRNVLDIIPDPAVAEEILKEYFEPVQIAEAESTRFKTNFRNKVRALNLSQKIEKGNLVSEAHAVQLLGEASDNIRVIQASRGRMKTRDGKTLREWQDIVNNLWVENPGLNKQKIETAVEDFRKIYDDLFQRMNKVRVRNGYEPVNYRQGYFPHFQPGDGDSIMVHFGKAMGLETGVETLPTTINGMTQNFKPGIQWFGNAQERLGFTTAYDAVQGFDKYIEGVANVIFHTENIQKLRALASQARYRTSDEGLRKLVDAVQADDRLTLEEKQGKIRDIYEHGKFTLSNFVVELDEYTNLLAGKKSKFDRTMESMMGRRAYTVMKNWESRVGANMIAGNMTSAFTNFIPLTQAGARLDRGLILKGMTDTLNAIRQDDGFAARSDFLTNRRGSDPITKAWELKSYQANSRAGAGIYAGLQKTSDIMGLPMEFIDNITSEAIVRAAYQQNIRWGLSENEAMHQADIFAANVMADRSKGSMPTMLEARNPLFKAFTQFQLEVNNQYSEIFKDLPREYRESSKMAFAMMLLKYFIGAFLYNELYEFLVGRRPALDPIGMLNSTIGDLTGYELPNLVELGVNTIKGEETSFETEKVGIGGAGKNLASEALGALPFSAGLTMFGIETDGGRIPASSAIPDFTALWDAATGDMTPQQRWKEIQDELNKLAYVIPPFGGNQLSKIWKGIKAIRQGGSYSYNQDGEEILQYPVYNDKPEDAFWNMVRATIFGKSSLSTAQDWANKGYNSFNADQTAAYKDMQEVGVSDRDAYALIDDLRKVIVPAGTPEEERSAKLREMKSNLILKSKVKGEGKSIAFYGLIATEKEQELMDQLADAGADQSGMAEFMIGLKNAKALKGTEKKTAIADLIRGSSFTDEEKKIVIGDIMGTDLTTDTGAPSQYAKFLSAVEGGLDVDQYLELYGKGISVDDYFDMKDNGLSANGASRIISALSQLEPKAGKDKVSWQQQCDAILKENMSAEDTVAALESVSYESTGRKIRIGYENGIEPKTFIELKNMLPNFDANGSGSYSHAEVTAAIDSLSDGANDIQAMVMGTTRKGWNLTNEQKAVLWQLQTGAKDGRSNPYDKAIGKYIYDTVQARAEGEK